MITVNKVGHGFTLLDKVDRHYGKIQVPEGTTHIETNISYGSGGRGPTVSVSFFKAKEAVTNPSEDI